MTGVLASVSLRYPIPNIALAVSWHGPLYYFHVKAGGPRALILPYVREIMSSMA